jgi:prepilin-type N-terminal cleavage/methylation domain-containing protein
VTERRQQGFTIIEILIVLAIAGLILLIVFFAVPALQRSARNSRRKNDLARFYTAIQEYAGNRNTQRAPFPGDDSDGYPGDPTTNAQDEAAFDAFLTNLRSTDSAFTDYEIPWVESGTAPHSMTISHDQIIYFGLHYCNPAGSGDLVKDTQHGRAIYSVVIGLEPDGRFYCLGNDTD